MTAIVVNVRQRVKHINAYYVIDIKHINAYYVIYLKKKKLKHIIIYILNYTISKIDCNLLTR